MALAVIIVLALILKNTAHQAPVLDEGGYRSEASSILEDLREEYEGEVNILTANVDIERDLVLKYKEEWFPAFLFFDENGELTRRIRGLIFEEDFRLAIEELLQGPQASFDVSSIAPEEVLERMNRAERLTIIDVRTQQEYASGHIPGAMLLPLAEIQKGGGAKP